VSGDSAGPRPLLPLLGVLLVSALPLIWVCFAPNPSRKEALRIAAWGSDHQDVYACFWLAWATNWPLALASAGLLICTVLLYSRRDPLGAGVSGLVLLVASAWHAETAFQVVPADWHRPLDGAPQPLRDRLLWLPLLTLVWSALILARRRLASRLTPFLARFAGRS